MRKRTCVTSMALACTTWLTGCIEPPSWFPFEARRAPRLFAYHAPLVPEPGGVVNVLSRVDGFTADDIAEARVLIEYQNGDSQSQNCTAIGSEPVYNCQFDLDDVADGDQVVIRASATLEQGVEGPSFLRADVFRMTVTSLRDDTDPRLVTVREPLAPRGVLEGTRYAIGTVLVRDAAEGFSMSGYVAAANALIHEAILEDPVYRWRSSQFAFYLYTEPAVTSDYYSGRDTRCGQNPWPHLSLLPSELIGMDAIGVLHQRAGPGGSFAGESVGGFRDCASRIEPAFEPNGDPPAIGTFSMKHGNVSSKRLGAHEFGHAVFGLGDEYNETTAERTAPAGNEFDQAEPQCCCEETGDDDGTVDGGVTSPGSGPGTVVLPLLLSQLYCIDEAGNATIRGAPGGPIPNGVEPCPDGQEFAATAPLECRAGYAPGACPSLAGQCVRETMWLGVANIPAAAAAYHNVFDSEAACNAARDLLLEHPGIENATAGMLAACVEQCGPDSSSGACACEEGAAYWRLDRDPVIADAADADAGDLMRRLDATVHHGAACNHCIETSLCVRWERARGRSAEETWDYCAAPSPDIVEQLDATRSFVASILEFLRDLFGGAKT